MIQNLDVISVNLWQILISLVNLLLLFLLMKKFLFKPVNAILEKRKAELDAHYTAAEESEKKASDSRKAWEETLSHAKEEADGILLSATDAAKFRAEKILEEARERADGIVAEAEHEAVLTHKKAEETLKKEIVDISSLLTEKLLAREINRGDHTAMIDAFLDELGEADA